MPDDCVIGAVDDGWRVSSSTLTHERGTNPRQLVIHVQHLDELLRLASAKAGFDDHRTAQRLAEAFVEVKLFQLHNWRSLSRLEAGQPVGPEGSTLKLYWSEMSQRLHRLALDVLGPAAALARPAPTTTRATANGSGRGSTTRPRRSSPAPTRSSARSWASACSACRANQPQRPLRDHRSPLRRAVLRDRSRRHGRHDHDAAARGGQRAQRPAHRRARRGVRPGRGGRRRAGGGAGRRGQALLRRPRPQGAVRGDRAVGGHAGHPGGQAAPRAGHVLRPLRAHPRLRQADHRRGAGRMLGGRTDAGVHVRPDRRGRRRPLLEPGPAHVRRRRRAAGRAVGAGAAQGQGVPAVRGDARRGRRRTPGPGQPGRQPRRAGRRHRRDGRARWRWSHP